MRAQEDDPTSTTVDLTTSSDLLVPGDGTEGAESTTTTLASDTPATDDGLSDATLIALVIVGLLVVAALVGVLTWRYWVATRPDVGDHREPADSVDAHG